MSELPPGFVIRGHNIPDNGLPEGFVIRAAAQPEKQSIGRTALDQGLQGATFGFADEAMDRLGAGIASLATDESYGDLLNEARGMSQARLQQQVQQNPGTSIAANIGGALLTGGAGASTKAGTAIGSSLRAGGTAARIAKGAAAGAASGGLYGAGTAQEGNRVEGAKQGAIYGGLAGGAIPAVGAAASAVKSGTQNAVRGAIARSPEALQDAVEGMRSNAGALYNKMRDVGAVLNPSSSNGLLATIDGELKKNKFIPGLNPKTVSIVDDLAATIQSNGGKIGLDELDQYRRLLGRIGATEDGVSAGAARRAIDNIVEGLNNKSLVNGGEDAIDLLNQGRAQYAKASKFDEIVDVLTKADGDPNRIKSGLTRFLNNEKNLRGFSKEEIAALKDAARSTTGEKLLKMGGKFGIDLGTSLTPGNTVAPLIGSGLAAAASGGGAAVLAPIAGTVARQGQKILARGKAENLLRAIEGAAPKAAVGNTAVTMLPAINVSASLTRDDLIRKVMSLPPAEARKLLKK